MLDPEYLERGLNAMGRAYATDYFADGHRGAAAIAAYYFVRETACEPGVAQAVREMIDTNWADPGLWRPFPAEAPDPGGTRRILACLEQSLGTLRQAGHNVILPALALKALRQRPELLTPTRVHGLCKLIEAFTEAPDIPSAPGNGIPDAAAPAAMAEFVLEELLTTLRAFDGRGQGWSGHLLTYARALLDLQCLGYANTAERGQHAFRLYVQRVRLGPLATDVPRPEHAPGTLRPHQLAYWLGRRYQPVGLGHVFKYPYGFYGLMSLTGNAGLRERCLQQAYRLF